MSLRISSMRKLAMEALVVDSSGDSSSSEDAIRVKRSPAPCSAPVLSPPLRSKAPTTTSPGTHHLDSDGGGVERALAHFQKKASRRHLRTTGRAQTTIVPQRPNEFHSPRTAKVEASLHALIPSPRRVDGRNPLWGTAASMSMSPSESRGPQQPLVASTSPQTNVTTPSANHQVPPVTLPPPMRAAVTPTLKRVQTHAAVLRGSSSAAPLKRVGSSKQPSAVVAAAPSCTRKATTAHDDAHTVSKMVVKKSSPPTTPKATSSLKQGNAVSRRQPLNTSTLQHHENVIARNYGTHRSMRHDPSTGLSTTTQLASSFHDEAMVMTSPAPRDPAPLDATSSGAPLAPAEQSRGRSYTIVLEYEPSAAPTVSPPPEATQFYCEDGRLLVSPSTSHHGDYVMPSNNGAGIPFSSGGDSMVPDTDSTVRTTTINASHRGGVPSMTAGVADETSSEYTFVECSLPPTPTRSPSSRPMAGRLRASSFTILSAANAPNVANAPNAVVSPNAVMPPPQADGTSRPALLSEAQLSSKPLLLSTRKPAVTALTLPSSASPKKSTRSTTPSTTPRSVVTPRTSRAAMATRVAVSPRNRDEVQRPTPAYVGIPDLESAEQELRGELVGREKAIAAIILSHASTDFALLMQTVIKNHVAAEDRRRTAIEHRWACELALEVQVLWDDMCTWHARELLRTAVHMGELMKLEEVAGANALALISAMERGFSNLQMMSVDTLHRLRAEAQVAPALAKLAVAAKAAFTTPRNRATQHAAHPDDERSPVFVLLSDSDKEDEVGVLSIPPLSECSIDTSVVARQEDMERQVISETFVASLRQCRQHHQQALLSNCVEAHARQSIAAHEAAARPQRFRKYAHATHRQSVVGAAVEWYALRLRLFAGTLEPGLRRCIEGDAVRQRCDEMHQHEAGLRRCHGADAAVAFHTIATAFHDGRELLFCGAVEHRSRSVIVQQEAAERRVLEATLVASAAMHLPPHTGIAVNGERLEHRERHERRRLYEWYIVRLSQIKGEFSQAMVKLLLHATTTTTASSPTALSAPSSGDSSQEGSRASESPRAPHCYGESDFANLILS